MNPAVDEWVSKAEGDFATAGRELRARKAPNYDAVCFHAQLGFVTSCAIDAERFLTGQAYLETPYTALDTPIFIHQGGALRAAQDGMMDRPPQRRRWSAGSRSCKR